MKRISKAGAAALAAFVLATRRGRCGPTAWDPLRRRAAGRLVRGVAAALRAAGPEDGMNVRPPNGAGQTPAFAGQTRAPEQKLDVAFDVVTVAEGLQSTRGAWRSCPTARCW